MTLQQLKYVVEVAERGSITEAAKALFIAQPSLSSAVRELEEEAGITIFLRNSRGILLTQEGAEFLGYARQVVQQAALIEDKYIAHSASRQRFSVSTQHYSFTSSAFVELVRAQGGQSYEFVLREGKTYDTIMDVRHLRSEMGVIYLCSFNEAVIRKTLRESNLVFSELFSARPHIFIGRNNPLAGRKSVNMKDLESLPCLTYEQGDQNSFYFSEEILSTLNHEKSIKVTDKGTIIDLMTGTDGYTISSGICPSYLRGDDIIRDANELLQKASDRADEIENEANEKRLAEEREYDRVRLEVTRFKADVLNLYRSHVESLSRLPEFQKDAKDAEKDAPAQDAESAQEAAAEQPAAQPETAPAADAAAAPAQQPAEPTETTEPAAPADDDKAADSSEDFWAKDESQLKLDPPPADMKPDEPDYDAFQGVKFSE